MTVIHEEGLRGRSLHERLSSGDPVYSFEFFPPRTDEGERTLWRAIRELEPLAPSFVSVTYGAGGSTRDRTLRIVERIALETTLIPVGHLTCVGSSAAELREIVGQFADIGVLNVLALRGDPPAGPGTPWTTHPDGFAHADELVRLLRASGDFCVGVAAFPDGHPESASLDEDARVLVAKAEAGAEFAVTQFFFDPDRYFDLVDRARKLGCDIPVLPGLMPVTDVRQVERFAQLSGTPMPDALVARLHAVADDPDAVRAVGVEVACELGSALLEGGAPGLHFYTLNRSSSTREVFQQLGLARAR